MSPEPSRSGVLRAVQDQRHGNLCRNGVSASLVLTKDISPKFFT